MAKWASLAIASADFTPALVLDSWDATSTSGRSSARSSDGREAAAATVCATLLSASLSFPSTSLNKFRADNRCSTEAKRFLLSVMSACAAASLLCSAASTSAAWVVAPLPLASTCLAARNFLASPRDSTAFRSLPVACTTTPLACSAVMSAGRPQGPISPPKGSPKTADASPNSLMKHSALATQASASAIMALCRRLTASALSSAMRAMATSSCFCNTWSSSVLSAAAVPENRLASSSFICNKLLAAVAAV
mmetsp:Transcript_1778/g.4524  ORF Transcript_1778/g.4524 Transcript_1778/m.4524 type:complete len:251 (-) Transcript_1778:1841-2593(-)